MRPILRVEILPPAEYELVRDEYRARVIAQKKERRVLLGPHMSGTFEWRDSVKLQVQEMLRTEKITTESAILHEIATYNHLIPAKGEVSLTLFVEIPDRELREKMLVELAGLEQFVAFEVDGQKFPFSGEREGAMPGRTTAVHYLKAAVAEDAQIKLAEGKCEVAVSISHPSYSVRTVLSGATRACLARDMADI